ncbi:MAG: phosphodiester glycosidase family protein [Acidimicrobiales bacterium]
MTHHLTHHLPHRLAVAVSAAALLAATACAGSAAEQTGTTAPSGSDPSIGTTATPDATEPVATTAVPGTEPPTAGPSTAAPSPVDAPSTTPPPLPPPSSAAPGSPLPGRLAPPTAIPTAVPGTGQWQPIGPPVGGQPGMYATTLPTSTGSIVGVAWIDPAAFSAQLFPGSGDPGGSWPFPSAAVPPDKLGVLGAAFNGGFKMKDSRGGFFLAGREVAPLRDGAASLVVFDDGKVTVGRWGRDIGLFPNVVAVRQNLDLLVDDGVASPTATDRDVSVWGATLNKATAPPRSGVGVRADGSLVYVGGPGLTARGLADALVSAGAVRAMTLDINSQWVSFLSFPPGSAGSGTKLVASMSGGSNRFVTPDTRDFVALYAR